MLVVWPPMTIFPSTHSINDDLTAQELNWQCTTIHKSNVGVEILGTIKEGIYFEVYLLPNNLIDVTKI